MNYSNIEMVPGIIIDVERGSGSRVKIDAPKYFDHNAMGGIKNIPWCSLMDASSFGGSISNPKKGQKVWVMHDKTNPNEFWYKPMYEENKDLQLLNEDDANNQVLMYDNEGGQQKSIYYSDIVGMQILNGSSGIELDNLNNVSIHNSSMGVSMDSKGVLIGKLDDAAYPAVNGEKLVTTLQTLANDIKNITDMCRMDDHLLILAPSFENMYNNIIEALNDENDNILCKYTKVN